MGLRFKILSGFLFLILILLIPGVWTIYKLDTIGVSIQKILDDNYASAQAAKSMLEALEREDSGILLLMLGQWEDGREIIEKADRQFEEQLAFAYDNISIEGEHEYLNAIKSVYGTYKNLWKRPIVDTDREGNLNWYFKEVHKAFLSVKEEVNKLMMLNEKIMYKTASDLENRANRAIMPGIIAIVSALIFTMIFIYLVNYFMVSPIIRITDAIRKFREKRISYDVKIESKDEIADLSKALKNLCESLEANER
jgi:methyl-accepting chemotaxis protein